MNATPTPAKPTRSPKQSRQEIMDNIRAAAISEFSQHGFIGASTQAIAERAGLKKSQLHYYIEDKESLYAQVLGQLMNAWSKLFVFGAQDSATPRQILGEYVRQKLEFALDHPEISRIFTNELLSGGTRLEGFWPGALSTTQSKVDRLQTWVDQGILRPLNPRLSDHAYLGPDPVLRRLRAAGRIDPGPEPAVTRTATGNPRRVGDIRTRRLPPQRLIRTLALRHF
ncbi:TetR family transcriptional regulator C-terminal domain-containing protein [Pseudomonas abieticivorans]|uniref:TetR family transcriptional regulator C-terminal domain-containing protein n=1 Tax=Pseudomonas abieticivorans TaxID=2931382 RepID=UPI0020C0D175|nr:TetR family transcriptional regulator C-terminal domain-containing protein [Pseudomonas sp. PIA16]